MLSPEECRELLRSTRMGRVGVSINALPAILPVAYQLVDGDLLFSVPHGSQLAAATANAVVALEVGSCDHDVSGSWSVLAVGWAQATTQPHLLSFAQALPAGPWKVRTGGAQVVRLTPQRLTGQRFPVDHDDVIVLDGAPRVADILLSH